ncbi:type I polyketide synthase [Rhizorhapis suberifaciens]|uniref:Acyl transferase domain-containing protein/thioesterase domain-containing protein n=1 Tax=Rhizorhapis suberifaciens TaxID=13656 RepID=A0A840HTM0_9SPHN|nr:type I polyketide synthase [Rhizorhapis suberifaciens]MBB4640957.1 acyl transferase domain-containing protein/thioesterase domain-containing protein [Rhizorhapis suberifaciens]
MYQSNPDFNGGSGGADFDTAIAVVGMACRFAGARNMQEYWSNLREGVESITRFSDDELIAAGVDKSLIKRSNYVKAGAPLPDMEMFDAALFGLSPRDAAIMDPQHRHFLQCAWAALEDAGHLPERFAGAIGVFAGSGHNAYLPYNLLTNPELVRNVGFFLLRHTGNDKDFLTTRVSYLLDLKGPSVNVQTACSTSLVAIHMAVQSLLNGESDMALAGGVTIELPHRRGYVFEQGEILSPDGHCRAFDAEAAGTIFGSGAGIVVLRRLRDAMADGDHIYAVVKGSAVNNDGVGKVSYLAPSVDGQAKVISEALSISGVTADTIGYVEAHGTGTPVGDPIEVAALTQAFRQDTEATGYCALGSVKPNIGHTDTAAGVASFIKVALALRHGKIPPSLNYSAANPSCEFERTPFYVNATLRPWEKQGLSPRRAGISSLGVGGTNSHVVLQEAPPSSPSGPSRPCQLLVVSAATETALEANAQALADHLRAHPDQNLADIAYTLQVGRKALRHRRVIVAGDPAEAVSMLEGASFTQQCKENDRSVAFLFAGGGAQYPNMALGLYRSELIFRQAVDECMDILSGSCNLHIREHLFPETDDAAAREALNKPSFALPALFTVQYAMARLWMSWGVEPEAMLGHSMGEYIAAHLAGVFDLKSALKLAAGRGRLFETLPEGRMLNVPLPEDELRPLLGPDLSIAAVNGPQLSVASGPVGAIERLKATLAGREIETQEVPISVAAHSKMLEPILAPFRELVQSVKMKAPKVPFISCLTGKWISADEATDANYWVRHLRETVRFADGLQVLLDEKRQVLLEVGPGRTLTSLARQHPARSPDQPVFNSLRHPDEKVDDLSYALNILGRLWASGVAVPWGQFWLGERRRRIPLPTYCFDRQRHWIEPGKSALALAGPGGDDPSRRKDLNDWLYEPVWQRTARLGRGDPPDTALVFLDDFALGEALVRRLRAEGCRVATARRGARFREEGLDAYRINPNHVEDYGALLASLGFVPQHIYHLWLVSGHDRRLSSPKATESLLQRGFYSLLRLAQALGEQGIDRSVRIALITDRTQRVLAESGRLPAKATALGACRVIPREYPNVELCSIDLDLTPASTAAECHVVEALAAELSSPDLAQAVAYRNEQRWVQQMEPMSAPTVSHSPTRLRPGGAYLITGGLGGIGLTLARHLSDSFGARLALLGKSPLPPRDLWADHLASHSPGDHISRRIREVQSLESKGAEVLLLSADVSDFHQMRRAIAQARARFGQIHGVFHTAGVLDDGPIQLKTIGDAAKVLAPKLQGTLALDAALVGQRPDFIMLFSSISAFAGIAGQFDYAAANAFLDAFAQAKKENGATPVISMGWSQWREVGMAASLVDAVDQPDEADGSAGTLVDHPLIDRLIFNTKDRSIYSATYSPETRWLLDEHRLASGQALVPGSGYVEIARAAFHHMVGPGALDLCELVFLTPFAVPDDQAREMRVDLRHEGGEVWRFAILGRSGDVADGDEWAEHARGYISGAERRTSSHLNLSAILARCTEERRGEAAIPSAAHLHLGERWNNVQALHLGDGEALIELSLPEVFGRDLDQLYLHPALLDFATAGAQMLIPGCDVRTQFYAPASYGRIRLAGPLPERIVSHVRYRPEGGDPSSVAMFDVTLATAEGQVLAEIEAFTMMLVRDSFAMGVAAKGRGGLRGGLAASAAQGLTPSEGMAVIEHILSARAAPHVVVSPVVLSSALEKLHAGNSDRRTGDGEVAALEGRDAPRTSSEEMVAHLWSEMLGVGQVRRNDNFFDLGGHSLLAVQFINRLRKQSGKSLPLTALIEAPTVAQLAALIEPPPIEDEEGGVGPENGTIPIPGLVSLRPGKGKPPLFLVHDGLGETLLYRSMALLLDEGHHVYGLQPEMRADGSFAHTRIDEMAATYVDRLRIAQPEGPYLLAGLCAGGVIAFEMARQLQDQDQDVRFVGIIDAADVEAVERPFQITLARLRRLRDVLSFRGATAAELLNVPVLLARKLNNVIAYELSSRIDRLRHHREVKRLRSRSIHEPRGSTLSFLELYQVAHRHHRPQGLLTNSNVVLYKATEGTGAPDDVPFSLQFSDCIMGWGKRVAEPVQLVQIPGGHTSALQEPNVSVLARSMQEGIDAALKGGSAIAAACKRPPVLSAVERRTAAPELLAQ